MLPGPTIGGCAAGSGANAPSTSAGDLRGRLGARLGGAPAARSCAAAFASAAAAAMTSIRSAACSSTSLKKPKRLSWWLLRCGSGCGLCTEAGARGAPPGGRGASIIFLGRGDPFQPEIVV